MIESNLNINIYNDTEIKIGTWFNKPLYRKIIIKDDLRINESTTQDNIVYVVQIPHNISNFDRCVNARMVGMNPATTVLFPFRTMTNNGFSILAAVDRQHIYIRYMNDWYLDKTFYFILEYTKL